MNLRAQAQELRMPSPLTEPGAGRTDAAKLQSEYHALKNSLHTQLLGRIDLNVMGSMKPERLREELGLLVEKLLQESGAALNAPGRKRLIQDILDEVMGLGPLEPLLADPT